MKPAKEELREKVRALLESGCSITETAKLTGLSKSGVFGMKRRFEKEIEEDEFAALRKRKKEEFIELAWENAKIGANIINQKLRAIESDKQLQAQTDMREISTSVGTIIDKARLASGEATTIVDGTVDIVKFEDM